MGMNVKELVKRVQRGAAFLDRKVPTWRRTMKAHLEDFYLSDAECCVLGTLEHFNAEMRKLDARRMEKSGYEKGSGAYFVAVERLKLRFAENYGFNVPERDEWEALGLPLGTKGPWDSVAPSDEAPVYRTMEAAWVAEILRKV